MFMKGLVPIPLKGPELTPLQIMKLCMKHGIDPDDGGGLNIVNAMCIAWGESSLFAGAWNFDDTSGDYSFGLWQINLKGAMGVARRAKYKITDDNQMYDPDMNASIMADMSKKGTYWKPWGAYTNGSYRAALGVAVATRAELLKSLGRPVSKVEIPVAAPVPLDKRPFISYKQVHAAAISPTGWFKTVTGDSSRDDVGNYQRGVWKLLPHLTYMYSPGYYDAPTRKATRELQLKLGLSGAGANGIVGPFTFKYVEKHAELFRGRDY
jgi:hypothetical protein